MNSLFFLDALREHYEESKNPLFAWEALKICLDEKHPLPDWVSGYLSEAASKLLDLSELAQRQGLDKRASQKFYEALGGVKNMFTRHGNLKRDLDILTDICQQIIAAGNPSDEEGIEKFLRTVAKEHGKSYSMVRKLFYDSRGKLGLLPENYEFELNEMRKKIAKNKELKERKAIDKQKMKN